MKNQTVFIDVDGTLLHGSGSLRRPVTETVALIRRLHADGFVLYLWSSGGADYARECAEWLELAGCFAAFLPKPCAYIDDQAVAEWHHCRHVLPQSAAYWLDEYENGGFL